MFACQRLGRLFQAHRQVQACTSCASDGCHLIARVRAECKRLRAVQRRNVGGALGSSSSNSSCSCGRYA